MKFVQVIFMLFSVALNTYAFMLKLNNLRLFPKASALFAIQEITNGMCDFV
jgi:hypothetical protein